MSWKLAEIYRHPVKSLGEEALTSVDLEIEKPMAWDRTWAITHGATEWSAENPVWSVPGNFINQTHVPRLAQIRVAFDDESGALSLSHPDCPELTIRPGTGEGNSALKEWIAPLTEGTARTGPFQVCQAPQVAFTDFEDTHISIATLPSLRALEEMVGQTLEPIRFRMNLWLDGPEPWEDLDWIEREIEIGGARLRIFARDGRCNATNANPVTGERDTEIPALLRKVFGHMDFGVYAQVIRGGWIRRGDSARLI